jgi:hypothetical protein
LAVCGSDQLAPDNLGLFSWVVELTDRLRIWLPRCGFERHG